MRHEERAHREGSQSTHTSELHEEAHRATAKLPLHPCECASFSFHITGVMDKYKTCVVETHTGQTIVEPPERVEALMSDSFLVAAKLRAADSGSARAAPASASGSQAEEKEPAPTPPPLHTLVDTARVAEAFGGEQMMGTILKSFLTRADGTMKKLHAAMAAGDITTLRREAHSLKGACGYIASDRLMGSAKALQFACDALLAGDAPDAPLENCFQSAITDFGFVCEAIRGIIGASQP